MVFGLIHPSIHGLATHLLFLTIMIVGMGSWVRAEVVWDPGSVVLESQRIGDGVYAVIPKGAAEANSRGFPVATSGGFVVGNSGVLVVEAMINERLAHQVINLIKQVTDKPIRYVVNTSYHGDHSYGNYAFPKSTKIIQHPNTQAYIMNPETFAHDKAFMMKNFGTNVGIEEVEARPADVLVKDRKELDLGSQRVYIMYWGFAQTSGDLFVWVPDAKVFWTGNPVVAARPALPWLLEGHHRESLATLQAIRRFLPTDAVLVPGHGRVMTVNEMDFTIQYLETLDNRVRTALNKNLSLEDTQQFVTMPDYGGYALFGWVHSGVNVPAVYKALLSSPEAD